MGTPTPSSVSLCRCTYLLLPWLGLSELAPQKQSQDQASHCLLLYRLLALSNYSDAHPGPMWGWYRRKVVVQSLCHMGQVAVCCVGQAASCRSS